MCGIVGGISQNNIVPVLLKGLKLLEYRGYDSAGMAVLDHSNQSLNRIRTQGKVCKLEQAIGNAGLNSHLGIAHTRWATHGQPSEKNAHPHASMPIMLIHNGIIENHLKLKNALEKKGYVFETDTDTEVIAHLIHYHLSEQKQPDLLQAVMQAKEQLEGAFSLGVISSQFPDRLIAARQGSPLVIGLGKGEHFIASDVLALLSETKQFIYLEDGDVSEIRENDFTIYDRHGQAIKRDIHTISQQHTLNDRGEYRHFMQKEMFEQAQSARQTLSREMKLETVFDHQIKNLDPQQLTQTKRIHIAACGTSYHAGLVAKHWFETISHLPCEVYIASEYRYAPPIVEDKTLFITLSQSGETADTLGALKKAKTLHYLNTVSICNVPHSAIPRASDFTFLTSAGTEIGVASTKAFTTQLIALLVLSGLLGQNNNVFPDNLSNQLHALPAQIDEALKLDPLIQTLARQFHHKSSALFLGRGIYYPIAQEGALKLKELSYIHAEAYPAGELKHGPLALIDEEMPVIAIAPNNELLPKLLSNLNEVKSRGGQLFIFADASADLEDTSDTHIITIPRSDKITAPIVYTVPLQLLAYHVALIKGTDVDQPRNLAKSVTVE